MNFHSVNLRLVVSEPFINVIYNLIFHKQGKRCNWYYKTCLIEHIHNVCITNFGGILWINSSIKLTTTMHVYQQDRNITYKHVGKKSRMFSYHYMYWVLEMHL